MSGGLVVAVLTFRRVSQIAELVPMLADQARAALDEFPDLGSTQVLVVDNDPDASARPVLTELPGIRYVHEPEPGISAGRNRALDEASDASLLVFIDDDERPTADWLVTLVRAKRESDAAGVVGRVERRFLGHLDPWIAAGAFFDNRHKVSGSLVPAAATNNLLLDLNVVRRLGLRFDNQFGLIGGGDTHFTRALIAHGERIVWCDEAVVDDQIPTHRLTRRWVLKRSFRAGNSEALSGIVLAGAGKKGIQVRVRYAAKGAARACGGSARVVVGTVTFNQSRQARGAKTSARGLGMIAGAIGHRHREYARS